MSYFRENSGPQNILEAERADIFIRWESNAIAGLFSE